MPVCLCLLAAWMLFTPAFGQDVSISGLAFGDAYWVAAHDGADLEGQNGFWFRRVYLTFDFAISEVWSARLRTEMNSPGDFTSNARLEPFAKDLYLRWKSADHQVYAGLSSTPTWNVVEDVWGYRSVEKTLVDLQRLGSSRDIGLAARGNLDAARRVRYHVMFANGGGTGAETNKGKKAMLSLALYPNDTAVFELYGDVDDRPGETNRYTLQAFAGFHFETGRAGIQYVYQHRDVEAGPDVDLNGLSLFGVLQLADRLHGYVRYDRLFDPNPDAGRIAYLPFQASARSNLVLLGLDVVAHEQVHFLPNVEVVFYDAPDDRPAPDPTVMPRLTFFFTF
ncbi:hypothetical protein GQ464_015320 [Rhodocaloribacter litoris]|uniref:hypothetical protein n=1 Tax=Rhodocaloribacter litoris TaxID=2558931 RepID=UPI0014231D4A|nr:hypothetical protein [Rhodocaloribacter litoris]QXD14777.1 hypothetical protein GQ464_015320 [Rhodocaloribacter litoris]